ncbi:MAG TPA: hypothetical protein VIO14_11725, partial [Dehalococcoidia bacterium]
MDGTDARPNPEGRQARPDWLVYAFLAATLAVILGLPLYAVVTYVQRDVRFPTDGALRGTLHALVPEGAVILEERLERCTLPAPRNTCGYVIIALDGRPPGERLRGYQETARGDGWRVNGTHLSRGPYSAILTVSPLQSSDQCGPREGVTTPGCG